MRNKQRKLAPKFPYPMASLAPSGSVQHDLFESAPRCKNSYSLGRLTYGTQCVT